MHAPLLLASRYALLRRLGAGGMAEVFLAKQLSGGGIERLVVIKRALPHIAEKPGFRETFLDEARAAADLRHANVVGVTDVGEDERGGLFLVMEFLQGKDVSDVIALARARDEPIPVEHALTVVIDAARGLDYAHDKRDLAGAPLHLVHRDVSPSNIFVTFDGLTKIIDFGIAKSAHDVENTAAGTIKGKVAYMSPEQARGEAVDRRTDVFALGVVLHELLAREGLFHRKTPIESMRAVFADEIPRLAGRAPGVDGALDDVLALALARDQRRRYASARELGDALERWLDERRLPYVPARVGRWLRQHFADEIEDDRSLGIARPLERETIEVTGEIGVESVTLDLSSSPSTSHEPLHNLPSYERELCGRHDVLDELHRKSDEGARVLGIRGPRGIGKTRIAVEWARRRLLDDTPPGGAWLVDLGEAKSAADLVAAVGRTLLVPLEPDAPLPRNVSRVGHALKGRGPLLLVLDPFEHLAPCYARVVAPWLSVAPDLVVALVTEEGAPLPGEAAVVVPPLALPRPGASADEVPRAPAVALLLERAREIDRGFAPNAAELCALGEIARRLEGMPLALELAAFDVAERGPAAVLDDLDEPAPGGTLSREIARAFRRLPPEVRDGAAKLAVFEAGFGVPDAEALLDGGAPGLLQTLRDASLMVSWEPRELRGDVRFGFPPAVRTFLKAELERHPDAAEIARRHDEHAIARAYRMASSLDGPGGERMLVRLALMRLDLVAAFERTARAPVVVDDARRALRAAFALDPVLMAAADDGLEALLGRAISCAVPLGASGTDLARVLELRGDLHRRHGALTEASLDYAAAARELAEAPDPWLEMVLERDQAELELARGDLDAARAHVEEARRGARKAGDRHFEARALLTRAGIALREAALAAARASVGEALDIFRHVGDRRFEGRALALLAAIAADEGDDERALRLARVAFHIHSEMGEPARAAEVALLVARIYSRRGDDDKARASEERAHGLFAAVGDRKSQGGSLRRLAAIDVARGERARAREELLEAVRAYQDADDDRAAAEAQGALVALSA